MENIIRVSIPPDCFNLDFLDDDPPIEKVLELDYVVRLVMVEHQPLVR